MDGAGEKGRGNMVKRGKGRDDHERGTLGMAGSGDEARCFFPKGSILSKLNKQRGDGGGLK